MLDEPPILSRLRLEVERLDNPTPPGSSTAFFVEIADVRDLIRWADARFADDAA